MKYKLNNKQKNIKQTETGTKQLTKQNTKQNRIHSTKQNT